MPGPRERLTKIDNGSPESHRRIQCYRLPNPTLLAPWVVIWPGRLPCHDIECFCTVTRLATWAEALHVIRDRVGYLANHPEGDCS